MTSVRTDDLALIDHRSPASYDDPEAQAQPVRSTRHITKWTPQRILIILTAAVIIILIIALVATLPRSSSPNFSKSPLNVILLIPDGTGPATFTLGRQLRQDKKLNIDAIITGTVQTYSSNYLTTDSAAAATAMACGVKTYNGAIGVNSTGHAVGSVLEAAKARGMRTGVIVTSRITHATPASFTAHVMNRDSEEDIAYQQFNHTLDFGFGGGLSMFNGSLRNDTRDLWGDLTKKGYHTMSTRTQFDSWKNNPIFPAFGLFDADHLPYEIDRNPAITPSLSEMVAAVLKGLEETATSGPGFFMLIEGSRIDMAGHNNDVAAHARELLAFDDAVGEALNFAKTHPNTLLLSAADHETGGLTLGLDAVEQYNPSTLLQIHSSAERIDKMLIQGAPINATLMSYASVSVTNDEYITIQEMIKKHDPTIYSSVLTDFIGKITSARLGFGWGTTHHTGVDVNLYSYGPAEWVARLTGNYQNTHIADVIASYLNLDLSSITRTLNTAK